VAFFVNREPELVAMQDHSPTGDDSVREREVIRALKASGITSGVDVVVADDPKNVIAWSIF
jgi:hypothetical protein